MVTCAADCSYHHLTNLRRKLKFPGVLKNSKQIGDLEIANIAGLGGLKAFFVLEQRNIDTWLYVTLTGHITIRPILEKNQSIRSEPQNIQFIFHVTTTKQPSQSRCYERNIVE